VLLLRLFRLGLLTLLHRLLVHFVLRLLSLDVVDAGLQGVYHLVLQGFGELRIQLLRVLVLRIQGKASKVRGYAFQLGKTLMNLLTYGHRYHLYTDMRAARLPGKGFRQRASSRPRRLGFARPSGEPSMPS